MKNKNIKTLVLLIAVLGMIALIIFSPVLKYHKEITSNLNNFFEMCKIGYNFSENDTVTIIRFLEYFIFGTIITAFVSGLSSKTIFKNSPIIMFSGLFVAVLEAHFRRLCIEDALISFVWIFIAMVCYVGIKYIGAASSKKSSSKYKTKKYDRRR